MIRATGTYLDWLCFPFHLRATFVGPEAFPPSYSFFEPEVLASAALILGSLFAALKIRKTWRELSFLVFWFFLSLVPVMNLVPLPIIIACRYIYLPSAVFCSTLAIILTSLPRWGGQQVSLGFLKGLAGVFAALIVASYSFATISRIPVWDNNFSLALEHAKNYPSVAMTRINLAGEYRSRGLLNDALRECKSAIALSPKSPEGYNDLGVTLLAAAHPDQAIPYFQNALDLKPDFLFAYCNLGLAYQALGRWEEARAAWQSALRLAPNHPAIQAALMALSSKR